MVLRHPRYKRGRERVVSGGGGKIKPIKPIKKIMVQTNTNHPRILPILKSSKSCSRLKPIPPITKIPPQNNKSG